MIPIPVEKESGKRVGRCNDKSCLGEYSRINLQQVGERKRRSTRVRCVVEVQDDARKATTSSDQRAAKRLKVTVKALDFTGNSGGLAVFLRLGGKRSVQVDSPGQWARKEALSIGGGWRGRLVVSC